MNRFFNSISLFLKPHTKSKNILLGGGIIFLISAIYLAASWGTTDVSVIKPRQLMMSWADKKQPFTEKKWQAALAVMESAVESNPNNARNYFDLARLYDWKAYQKPIWNKETISKRAKAIHYYKKALEYRPTWSSAWINLAMSQTLNMEFGDEAKAALTNAMTYGAWETGVFNKIVWLSLANWDGLPLSIQNQVKSVIKKTVDKNGRVPRYVQQVAEHFDWQDELKEVVSRRSIVM